MRQKIASSYSRPKRCPSCGSKQVENILHNVSPVHKPDKTGQCGTESAPRWQCVSCGVKIYMKTSRKCRG